MILISENKAGDVHLRNICKQKVPLKIIYKYYALFINLLNINLDKICAIISFYVHKFM